MIIYSLHLASQTAVTINDCLIKKISSKDYVRRHGGSFFPDGGWRDRLLAPLHSPCCTSISDIFQVFLSSKIGLTA